MRLYHLWIAENPLKKKPAACQEAHEEFLDASQLVELHRRYFQARVGLKEQLRRSISEAGPHLYHLHWTNTRVNEWANFLALLQDAVAQDIRRLTGLVEDYSSHARKLRNQFMEMAGTEPANKEEIRLTVSELESYGEHVELITRQINCLEQRAKCIADVIQATSRIQERTIQSITLRYAVSQQWITELDSCEAFSEAARLIIGGQQARELRYKTKCCLKEEHLSDNLREPLDVEIEKIFTKSDRYGFQTAQCGGRTSADTPRPREMSPWPKLPSRQSPSRSSKEKGQEGFETAKRGKAKPKTPEPEKRTRVPINVGGEGTPPQYSDSEWLARFCEQEDNSSSDSSNTGSPGIRRALNEARRRPSSREEKELQYGVRGELRSTGRESKSSGRDSIPTPRPGTPVSD